MTPSRRRSRSAGLAGQRHEEVELERREAQRLLAPLDRVAGDVDRQVTDGQPLGLGLVPTAQAGAQPGDELLGLEGLDDVVVGARLEADDDVDGVGAGGEHDDRQQRPLLAQVATHLQAVEARHRVEELLVDGAGLHHDHLEDVGPRVDEVEQPRGDVFDHPLGGLEVFVVALRD